MALERIYNALQDGEQYGRPVWDVRFPYFQTVLYVRRKWADDPGVIFFSYFGSSAKENTLEGLQWIIENIFGTTPEQFEKEYTTLNTLKKIVA